MFGQVLKEVIGLRLAELIECENVPVATAATRAPIARAQRTSWGVSPMTHQRSSSSGEA